MAKEGSWPLGEVEVKIGWKSETHAMTKGMQLYALEHARAQLKKCIKDDELADGDTYTIQFKLRGI